MCTGTSNQACEMTFNFCVTFPRGKKKGKRLEPKVTFSNRIG